MTTKSRKMDKFTTKNEVVVEFRTTTQPKDMIY